MRRQPLLACGVLASLVYVATDLLAAARWAGYSYTAQTISETFAIGAPTRPLVLLRGVGYSVLVIAFGVGVWSSAGDKRPLRVVGGLLVAIAVIDLVAPFVAPMHLRGAERTLTDTMHIVLASVDVFFILLIVGFGASAFGKRFRLYSVCDTDCRRRVRHPGRFGRSPDRRQPAHAVGGIDGAHQRLQLHALARSAGHRSLARPGPTASSPPPWGQWFMMGAGTLECRPATA